MNWMNSHVDEIEDFVKENVPLMTDNKKGKQVSFSYQLPSQVTTIPRNQGASSRQTRIEDCNFLVDFLVIDIKITNELSQAAIIL